MIEKSQNSSNISASINYLENGNEKENKINYLNKSDNKQIRELYSYNGEKITAKKGIEYIKNFKYYDIRIYNPLSDNLTKSDMHKMARDIIDARSKQSRGKITGIYAIHQRPDETNKHLHIIFVTNDKKALDKTGRGNEWQKIRTKIELKYTKNDLEKQKVIEYYNKALQTLKSRLTGTEKIDKFILQHMNKDNGNFGLKRALISIKKSKSIKNKEYYIKRLTGRLKSLEKQGIIQQINENTYKVDIEKFTKMIEERAKEKIEKNLLKKEQIRLKNKIKNLYTQKSNLYNQQKINSKLLKTPFLEKKAIIDKIKATSIEINRLDKEITKTKIEILDKKLLENGKINPFKGAEYLLKNTTLSNQKVREITELQLKRLEQLKRKGLVEKKDDFYIVKDKQKFREYINSQKANSDRTRIAKSNTTNKVIRSKVNNFINRNSKIRPIKDFRSSYYHLSRTFGSSTGDRMVAFAVAVGYSIAKTSIKLAIKTAISVIRTFIKITNKAIQHTKNKNFERKINRNKTHNKPKNKIEEKSNKIINENLKNKENKGFSDKFIDQKLSNKKTNERQDKFSEEIEKNKEFDRQSINKLLNDRNIKTSYSHSK